MELLRGFGAIQRAGAGVLVGSAGSIASGIGSSLRCGSSVAASPGRGAISYGAGLFSPALDPGEFNLRFHGHDERVDVESLRLTAELWERVVTDLMT